MFSWTYASSSDKQVSVWVRQCCSPLCVSCHAPQATRAEHAFCYYLVSRGINLRQQQGFTPFYRIADFFLPERNLMIEIDGGYHDPVADRRKDDWFLKARGIRTLRLTNEQVLNGNILLQLHHVRQFRTDFEPLS
jgi:very-short-patch-repair endonuclease